MSDTPRPLTRNTIARIVGDNPRAIRAFEQMLQQLGVILPADIVTINRLIQEAQIDGASAAAVAQMAVDAITALSEVMALFASAPPVEPMLPEDDLTPPRSLSLDDIEMAGVPQMRTQVETPGATGFSVTVAANIGGRIYDIWLLLKPAAAYAAGTIVLPAVAGCVDRQVVTVSCTQQVDALTVDGNGGTVSGAPSALAADSTFKLRFDLASTTWHRAE